MDYDVSPESIAQFHQGLKWQVNAFLAAEKRRVARNRRKNDRRKGGR